MSLLNSSDSFNSATNSATPPGPAMVPPAPVAPATGNMEAPQPNAGKIVDRRRNNAASSQRGDRGERRQFGSSHMNLSAEGRELAAAIDSYKLRHHRRYITCDEMLVVLRSLGYQR